MSLKKQSSFSDLRRFARSTIPDLLRGAGGFMDKQEMHDRIERMFIRDAHWPAELLLVQKNGCTAKTNAIAWAMADLVMRGVTQKSMGNPVVRLARP